MSSIREPLTATYDVAHRVKNAIPLSIYAGLRKTLAAQNSSTDLFLPDAYLLDDSIHGISTATWPSRAIALKPKARTISLAEAQNMAVRALHAAEARRQAERQREADFWASLEEE